MWLRGSSMCSRIGPGDWRGFDYRAQANDRWEMKIVGPHAFERSHTLEGAAGEHRPQVIGQLLTKARFRPARSAIRKIAVVTVSAMPSAVMIVRPLRSFRFRTL
jgi:hypothetical protein